MSKVPPPLEQWVEDEKEKILKKFALAFGVPDAQQGKLPFSEKGASLPHGAAESLRLAETLIKSSSDLASDFRVLLDDPMTGVDGSAPHAQAKLVIDGAIEASTLAQRSLEAAALSLAGAAKKIIESYVEVERHIGASLRDMREVLTMPTFDKLADALNSFASHSLKAANILKGIQEEIDAHEDLPLEILRFVQNAHVDNS